MVFSSAEFLFIFLPVFLLFYFGYLRGANGILLTSSLLFYVIGEGWFVIVMLVSITGNFLFGRQIGAGSSRTRRYWLSAGIGANILLLGYYKYIGFLVNSVLALPEPQAQFAQKIHLPLGISFFTFQAISYLVDVYRRETLAETSLVRLGAYIAMFPQLVAGPIVRFSTVADQLRSRYIGLQHLYYGLAFFAVGMAAKVLIADGLAGYADSVFTTDPTSLRGDTAFLGILVYSLQIYFDFLGYSSMAVGLGFALGFSFPRNFNFPYSAQSIGEFWRRWHISLSNWFRDYVYIPLGGNRKSLVRTSLNLWFVFVLTGLWHGAAWNFIVWGMFHGMFLSFERAGGMGLIQSIPRVLRHIYLCTVVGVGWVLFRASDLPHAVDYLIALIRVEAEITPWLYLTNETVGTIILAMFLSSPIPARLIGKIVELPRYVDWPRELPPRRIGMGLLLYTTLIGLSVAKILSGSYSPFIYFRF
jgi:alginate O-acetyltransferase complex protein AlgI